MRSTTSMYFAEVSALALPTKAEERQRFEEYAVLRASAEIEADPTRRETLARARDRIKGRIAEGYLRFVIRTARDLTRDRGTLLADLINAGNEGLMIAVGKFDLRYGTRFLTYAAYWIEVKMHDVLNSLDVVHVPAHARKKLTQRGDAPPPLTVTPIDDVQVAAPNDVHEEARPRGAAAVAYLHAAGLSRRERVVLNLALGLRGSPLDDDRLALVLLGMDGSLMVPSEVRAVRVRALAKLQAWVAAQGAEAVRLELAG